MTAEKTCHPLLVECVWLIHFTGSLSVCPSRSSLCSSLGPGSWPVSITSGDPQAFGLLAGFDQWGELTGHVREGAEGSPGFLPAGSPQVGCFPFSKAIAPESGMGLSAELFSPGSDNPGLILAFSGPGW